MATSQRATRERKNVNYKEPGQIPLSMLERDYSKDDAKDDDGDFEMHRPGSAGKAKKRPQPDGGASPRTPSGGKRRSGNMGPPAAISDMDSLAGIILNKSSAIPMAAKAWWTLFETDPISAVHKLTHMVLEMCGIQETLPLSVFQEDDGTDMDVDDYIKKLVAQYTSEKNAQLVPMLFGANKQAKKNQNNFADFWSKWVSHAPESEVQFLHENSFCPWLYAMSTSQLTVLRHAAATVGVEIMIALVGKANDNLEAMSNIERLHNAAKGVQKDRLQEQLDDKRKVRSDTEKALESFFNSLVVHRHRDIESQIRAKSIKAIGELVVRYKHMFLDNKYLKYVGWALSDKKEDVRLTALGAIQNFYEEDLAQELELFTGRFKERVVQMRFDKDRQVQLLAIDTAKVMVQKSLFVDEEVETMLQMITEEDPLVRGAVADFIQATFVEIDLEVAYEAHAKKTPKNKPDKDAYVLKGVVEMLNAVAGDFHHLHPIVDSLLPHMPFLKNIDLLCNVLMEEGVDDEDDDVLTASQRVTLAEMLEASIALATGNTGNDDSANFSGKRNAASKTVKESCLAAAQSLPALLRKFGAEDEILEPIVLAISHLVLDVFSAKDKVLNQLAEIVADVTQKAQSEGLLDACGRAAANLLDSEYAARSSVEGCLAPMLSQLISDVRKACNSCEKGKKLTQINEMAVNRATIIGGHVDLFSKDGTLRDYLVSLLKIVAETDGPGLASVSAIGQLLAMGVQYLGYRVGEDEVKDLTDAVEVRDCVIECADEILRNRSSARTLKNMALVAIGDVAQICGRFANKTQSDLALRPNALEVFEKATREVLSSSQITGEDKSSPMQAIWKQIPEDSADPSRMMRLAAYSALKAVSYHEGSDPDTLANLMCDLMLYSNYGSKAHSDVTKVAMENALSGESADAASFWLLAHQQMFERITAAYAEESASEKIIDKWSANMIDSVSNLRLSEEGTEEYVESGMSWVLETRDLSRVSFLDPLGMHAKRLTKEQAGEILVKLEDVCRQRGIALHSTTDDDESRVKYIRTFHRSLLEANDGAARRGGASFKTPSKSAYPVLTMTSSGGKRVSTGSAQKRKGRAAGGAQGHDEDDDENDGWVNTSQTSSGGKKARV